MPDDDEESSGSLADMQRPITDILYSASDD
jgi:hypothetical protein